MKIMENLLQSWIEKDESRLDGEDVVMEDVSPETQLRDLRTCVDQYRSQIEGNQWLSSLITAL
jgi:DNA mismatch repair protein MSH2